MDDSIHMYNDAIVYEGKTVTPVTHLTENNYSRTGYLFAGWNTEPDGSGTAYADKAAIENLRQADWRDRTTWTDNDHGVVNLYAQWVRSESTLVLYANGGKYDDREIFSVTQPYLERYLLQEELVCAPDGYTVCFRANGGSEITPVQGKNRFVEWKKVHPFRGSLDGKQYIFDAPDGNVDRLTAVYQPEPVTLPETTRPGWSFGGWYYDSEFRRPAGGAGDSIIPSENTTLYAQWVDLTLLAKDNYKENEGKGAVDLSWEQTDHNNKTYLIYQRLEDGAWMRINSATDINSGAAVELTGIYEAKTRTYNVPYTGLYVIKAMGAQGQGYGSFRGGCGGSASGTFWLQRGNS
ncbi:MAG: InlB B-repeat-containing protein [Waltera sp.]